MLTVHNCVLPTRKITQYNPKQSFLSHCFRCFIIFTACKALKKSKKKTKPLELVLLLPGFESLWQHQFSLSGSNNPRLFKTKKWVCKSCSISGKTWFCSLSESLSHYGSTPVLPENLYFWQNLTGYWFKIRGGEPSPFFQRAFPIAGVCSLSTPLICCLCSEFYLSQNLRTPWVCRRYSMGPGEAPTFGDNSSSKGRLLWIA